MRTTNAVTIRRFVEHAREMWNMPRDVQHSDVGKTEDLQSTRRPTKDRKGVEPGRNLRMWRRSSFDLANRRSWR